MYRADSPSIVRTEKNVYNRFCENDSSTDRAMPPRLQQPPSSIAWNLYFLYLASLKAGALSELSHLRALRMAAFFLPGVSGRLGLKGILLPKGDCVRCSLIRNSEFPRTASLCVSGAEAAGTAPIAPGRPATMLFSWPFGHASSVPWKRLPQSPPLDCFWCVSSFLGEEQPLAQQL